MTHRELSAEDGGPCRRCAWWREAGLANRCPPCDQEHFDVLQRETVAQTLATCGGSDKTEATAALARSIRAHAIEAGRQLGLPETVALGVLARAGRLIDADEATGVVIERSESDPTLLTVSFPPPLLEIRLTADPRVRDWLADWADEEVENGDE